MLESEDTMSYTVRSTEKLKKPGADMETKSLLYLMNFCIDSDEIRDEQSSKKNGHVVEGIVISTCDEYLNFYRHLTNSEIRLMTLQRIINRDLIAKVVPFLLIRFCLNNAVASLALQ